MHCNLRDKIIGIFDKKIDLWDSLKKYAAEEDNLDGIRQRELIINAIFQLRSEVDQAFEYINCKPENKSIDKTYYFKNLQLNLDADKRYLGEDGLLKPEERTPLWYSVFAESYMKDYDDDLVIEEDCVGQWLRYSVGAANNAVASLKAFDEAHFGPQEDKKQKAINEMLKHFENLNFEISEEDLKLIQEAELEEEIEE